MGREGFGARGSTVSLRGDESLGVGNSLGSRLFVDFESPSKGRKLSSKTLDSGVSVLSFGSVSVNSVAGCVVIKPPLRQPSHANFFALAPTSPIVCSEGPRQIVAVGRLRRAPGDKNRREAEGRRRRKRRAAVEGGPR